MPNTSVKVMFFSPARTAEYSTYFLSHSMNQAVAYMSPPYCHTELRFPNSLSLSIVVGGNCRLMYREFDPERYDAIQIFTTTEKLQKAIQLSQDVSNKKVKFGFTLEPSSNSSSTYCSKLVYDILAESTIYADDLYTKSDYGIITPSNLAHNLLMKGHQKSSVFNSEPIAFSNMLNVDQPFSL